MHNVLPDNIRIAAQTIGLDLVAMKENQPKMTKEDWERLHIKYGWHLGKNETPIEPYIQYDQYEEWED